jgi:hypothetical protein
VDGHHVFTAIAGFGLRVIPRAPFVAIQGPNPGDLDIEHRSPGGRRFARILPQGQGRYKTLLDQRTPAPGDVFTVEPGPASTGWQLDTGPYRVLFPKRFALHSVPAGSPSPFDLVGPGGSLIFAQSPGEIPDPREMCGPGQRIVKSGKEWVELAYELEGKPWWQRHQICGQVVFSAQAPSEHAGTLLSALKEMLESLVVP